MYEYLSLQLVRSQCSIRVKTQATEMTSTRKVRYLQLSRMRAVDLQLTAIAIVMPGTSLLQLAKRPDPSGRNSLWRSGGAMTESGDAMIKFRSGASSTS